MELSPRKKRLLDFINSYRKKHGFAPSIPEMAKHLKRAASTIHQHLEELKAGGYLNREKNRRRATNTARHGEMIEIPLLGIIAAGQPVDTFTDSEKISVPKPESWQTGNLFALKVMGDSMVEDGVLDGDTVVVREQNTLSNGEIGVAMLPGGEVTLKRIYREKNKFRLQPANPNFKPIYTKELTIQGKLLSVIRQVEDRENGGVNTEEPELTRETIKYLEESDLSYRKSLGQYFTPKSIREALLNKLPKNIKNSKIFDPACGTGEFLITAKKYFPDARLHGSDIDDNLVKITKKVIPESHLKTGDSLKDDNYGSFDFVIGNPPYFEFKPEKSVREKFQHVISGRPNIFALFIYQGLMWLKDGGYLAFVIPPSMNNGAYFSGLRNFIIQNSNIEHLEIIRDSKIFHGAQQSTMLMVLKKGKNEGDYIFRKNGISIFSENPSGLAKLFKNSVSLAELGYTAKTGRIVWNQNRHHLTHESKNNVPLIWAHNIDPINHTLKFGNGNLKKPQYIKRQDYDIGPAIVVNRITGSISETKLRAAIVPANMKFFAENHVNVIFPPKDGFVKNKKFPAISIKKITEQLSSPEKSEIMKNITGNTQISKTELEKLFPITL